jgi:hypothetical protein
MGKYKHTSEDLKLIGIGFIPALIALYIIYYLAYFLWWVPFVVVFPALAYYFGMLLEEKVMVFYYMVKKALDK